MKLLCILLASTAMLVACQQAGTDHELAEQVRMLQETALKSDLASSLLHSLTTEVGPRMAGTEGDRRAVEWSESIMNSLGFDKVWTEPVTFPRWYRGGEKAFLLTAYRLPIAVTAIGGSPGTNGLLRREVIEFKTLDELRLANAEDIQGKIVFINHRMERSNTGRGYASVVAGRTQGPYVAAEMGAAALIIRSVGTDNNRLAHTGMMSKADKRPVVPSAALSNPDADLLASVIESGKTVELELELDCGFDGAYTSYNVIGEITGLEADAGYFVMGAHLDSWDLGTGAVDDGAGVAIVITAAKLIADSQDRARRGLRVILYANEEQGIYGGKEYARAHSHELASHVAGAESDLGSGRVYALVASVREQAGPQVEKLATLLSPLGVTYKPDLIAYGGADVGQLRNKGVPVFDLRQDASLYFDLHHTSNDTLDKVNPDDLKQNVAAWVTLAWFVANSTHDFGPLETSQ